MLRYFNVAAVNPGLTRRVRIWYRSAISTDELHPRIYAALIGLTIWLVLSVWVLFSRGSYVGLNDLIITLLFAVFVGIPVMFMAVVATQCRTAGSEP